ncbi:MAG TPA: ABC transporter ATP-binding protein [Pyrinomonadaceae bacterium]|nr:ABC transporter ATP-binding protein [Pyrinomonadaceae bacterium]
MSFIVVSNVSKVYGTDGGGAAAPVLAGVDLEVREGEFVSLMGPSGSGKSTLLTVIGAMRQPTTGKVVVDGIDVYGLSEERRADFRREYIGFVFQHHHLMPYLSAAENAMLPLAVKNMTAVEKRERAMSVLERVGLADKSHRLPGQLSGGEQGRLAIARAVVNEPPFILADEPTGTLDTKTGGEIMEVFLDLNAHGQTIFMVTHNPENAALAHRTLNIRDGRPFGEGWLAAPAHEVEADTFAVPARG